MITDAFKCRSIHYRLNKFSKTDRFKSGFVRLVKSMTLFLYIDEVYIRMDMEHLCFPDTLVDESDIYQ